MMHRPRPLLITSLLILAALASVEARRQEPQPPTPTPTPTPTATPAPAPPPARVEPRPVNGKSLRLLPLRRDFAKGIEIPVGEKLEYEIKYSRFPIYANVGVVTFENLGPATPIPGLNIEYAPPADDQLLRLRSTAVSKGILLAILGIDVHDRFENIVSLRDFSTRLSFDELKEGKKHRTQSGLFDEAEQQVKYLTTNLANPKVSPKIRNLPREEGMLSLLTAIYFVRLQKYKEGQTMVFPVSYDEENYTFEVRVGKTEKLKTECGKIKAIRLEPQLFGPGKFFNRKGEMTMWMSRDRLHVPLRLVAKTSSGTVTARLLNFRKNCQLIDIDEEALESTSP
ncbi:MAG: DUF3108 domain-containing protein [Acidobacteriota bacterium]